MKFVSNIMHLQASSFIAYNRDNIRLQLLSTGTLLRVIITRGTFSFIQLVYKLKLFHQYYFLKYN